MRSRQLFNVSSSHRIEVFSETATGILIVVHPQGRPPFSGCESCVGSGSEVACVSKEVKYAVIAASSSGIFTSNTFQTMALSMPKSA